MKSKISILLLLISISVYPQNDIRVISSNQNSIIIEYNPVYLDTSVHKIDNQVFRSIVLDYGYFPDEEIWGLPAIPERRINIGVPLEFGNTIEILNTTYIEINGLVLPKPKPEPDGPLNAFKYEVGDGYYSYQDNPELVVFGSFGITRGVKNQTIRILPVKFDPLEKKIKLYKKIVFRINYAKGGAFNPQPVDKLLSGAFINYNVARYWSVKKKNKLNKSVFNSVLAEGEWVKFEAPEEGIYKIDYNFLTSIGFDPGSIDPRTIKIYNNGGKLLPENVSAPRPVDLVENAIMVVGEDDGKFDQNDYILFYGRGTNFWDYDTTDQTIKRYRHWYSRYNYYWITYGGSNGKRIQDKPGLNTTPDYVQTSTKAFVGFEQDKINIGKTGREFYGDDFSQAVLSRTYVNSLTGRLNEFPIKYKVRFINASSATLTLSISENGTVILNQGISGYGSDRYTVGRGITLSPTFNGVLPDNRSLLKFSIVPSSVSSVGYLDYFEIFYEKELKAFNDQILFFSKDTTAIIEYYLHDFTSTNIEVFDVTDYANVRLITNHVQLSGGDCRFQISETEGKVSKYYAVGSSKYFTPQNAQPVENSNLHGIADGAEYIIITPKEFMEAANRLKDYRENNAVIKTSTIVIDIEDIFNEFSCGVVDVSAIRDFIKYAYDNWTITPGYVLFLGKGTYDYKDVEGFHDNFIPTYQTVESLRLLSSYTSDDFFVNVDGTDSNIDLVIGRVPASNLVEANNYITKVIDYELNSKRGAWKNLITLVADDGLTTTTYEGAEHTRPSEIIANSKIPPSYDINKIYMADYPATITGAGRRKPEVNQDIIDAINNGTLLINYIGHGSPELWAHEIVFEKSVTIPQLHNSEYFFLVAATCDFAYYDIPNFQSAGDELLLKANSGAIADLSSARLVFSNLNHQLNFRFLEDLFDSGKDTLNLMYPIGRAYFSTKQSYNGTNDKKYHIFGDPLVRLQAPQYEGTIDSVNGQPLVADVQIKALSNTKIAGKIIKPTGEKWNDFNGEGLLTVFDSERTKHLDQIDFDVVLSGGVIFRGRVSVNDGEFDAGFVVPKDISYENKNGKIIFYFFNNSQDGLAFTKKIIVGGTDTTAVNDGEGPKIEVFFDNAEYYNAYLVGPEPKLIVKLSDETGLNTTGTGVGHSLEGILNEDETNPIDFSNYFTGDLDAGGKTGEVNYKFYKLNTGDYNLLVKAWDVFNNFSSEEAFFTVVNNDQLVIRDIYNYPNPFSSNTTFTFQHNLNKPIDVKIKIYTIAGRLIKVIEEPNIDQKFVKINWDGRDEDGDVLANGTYLYKVIVRTTDGEFSQSALGKMSVIK